MQTHEPVGWVERSDTHQSSNQRTVSLKPSTKLHDVIDIAQTMKAHAFSWRKTETRFSHISASLLAFALSAVAVTMMLGGCKIETSHEPGKFDVKIFSSPDTRTARYECTRSPETGQCHYVLFTRKCERKADTSGDHVVETCDFAAFDRFTLRSGQSREIKSGLPENFQACMDVKVTPKPGQCASI